MFEILVLLLGLIGFVAVSLLPYRIYRLLKQALASLKIRTSWQSKLQLVFTLILSLEALYVAGEYFIKVAICLLKTYCSASASGGWVAIAIIGVIYLAFEVLVFIVNFSFNQLQKKL